MISDLVIRPKDLDYPDLLFIKQTIAKSDFVLQNMLEEIHRKMADVSEEEVYASLVGDEENEISG